MGGLCWTSHQHWWEQANSTWVEFHLSETSGPCRARTWTARLTDRGNNHHAISPPPGWSETNKISRKHVNSKNQVIFILIYPSEMHMSYMGRVETLLSAQWCCSFEWQQGVFYSHWHYEALYRKKLIRKCHVIHYLSRNVHELLGSM